MSQNKPQHQMIFKSYQETDFEEWHCPTCGRRILMKWPPKYKKIVLEPGDDTVSHNVWKTDPESMLQDSSTEQPDSKDFLAPWQTWMDSVDFNSRWVDKR